MNIEEAYEFLGLDNSVDTQTLCNKAFQLYQKYFGEKDMKKVVKLEKALKMAYADIKMRIEEESSKENTSETPEFDEQPNDISNEKSETETYEFYEHMYDNRNKKTITKTDDSYEHPNDNSDEKTETKPYEFYEHLYDYPNEKTTTDTSKLGISFEMMMSNEIKLNKAKLFITDHLSSLIQHLDVIYDLEHLRKFIADNCIDQVIEAGFQDKNNKSHK